MELILPKNQDFKVNLKFAVILPVKIVGLYGELKIYLENGVNYDDGGILTSNTYSKKIELFDISNFMNF